MSAFIKTGMILAAGRGVRMRELTDHLPKPLISIAGEPIITRIVNKMQAHGIQKIVINTSYKGDMIKSALKSFDLIHYSDEPQALETGGGVKNALPILGNDPFFVSNADPVWIDKTTSVFTQLEEAWNPETTDILLALIPLKQAFGDVPDGNYFIENGLPRRQRPGEKNIPYMFMGVQIIHPRVFKKSPDGIFSLRVLYDTAEREGRLRHIVFDGEWYHIGTPEALLEANKILEKQEKE